jgi:cell division septum initiation protein DivIVA
MSEHSDLLPEGGMEWEREVRGYNRQQVDNYVAWRAGQVREMESRLSQSLAEIEHLRHELVEAREAGGRPPHEEISERVGQILKLAADEAKSDRKRGAADANELRAAAREETDKLRADVKQETDRVRTDAQDRAERILTAAQEQADRAVAAARAEADEMVSSAHASAEQTINDANSHAEDTVTTALAQAKQQLDDATARATAIHDGAERRLNLLISRHTETVRRLTEIRDVVTGLVSGETARGSLEDEVNRALGVQVANGAAGQHDPAASGPHRVQRQPGPADGRRQAAPAGPLDPPAAVPAARAATAVLQGGHDAADDDPLTGPVLDLHDGPRSPGRDAEAASSTHPTEAAMKAAEEIRQAAEARRRQAAEAGAGSAAPAAQDRVLDETAAGGARGAGES